MTRKPLENLRVKYCPTPLPYSSDVGANVFFILKLKTVKEKTLKSLEEVKNVISKWVKIISTNFYGVKIKKWLPPWEKCIQNKANYINKLQICFKK